MASNIWEATCWELSSNAMHFHNELRYKVWSEPCVKALHLHHSKQVASVQFHDHATEAQRFDIEARLYTICPCNWVVTVDEEPPPGACEIQ